MRLFNALSFRRLAPIEQAVCYCSRWPMLLLSEAVSRFDVSLRVDVDLCISSLAQRHDVAPHFAIEALVMAEDHRSKWHPGVDPIAIVRCLTFRFLGIRQGGSTIEQQFVRTALGRYENTLKRKLREQVLAVLLASRVGKYVIASSYLQQAYFGTEARGLRQIAKVAYGCLPDDLTKEQVIEIIARLKYPQPRRSSEAWRDKFSSRCAWLRAKLASPS